MSTLPPPTPTDLDGAERPKLRPWRWIIGMVVLSALLLVWAVWINLFADVPLRISPETTYITEPLTADGKWVDYLAALEQRVYPPEMQTDDNGARLIVRALGAGPDVTPEIRDQIYRKLGLNPATPPTHAYEEPYVFLQRYTKEQEALGLLPPDIKANVWDSQLADRLNKPWTLDDLPMMEAWLEQSGPGLDVVAEAAHRPAFCLPYTRKNGTSPLFDAGLEQIMRTRGFARGFAARARYRVATGDIDGAIDDMVATARLGRRQQHGAMVIDLLVGLALEEIADSIGIASSLEHPPTAGQLQRLLDEWNQLPPRGTYELSLEMERWFHLDLVQSLARDDWSNLGNLHSDLRGLDNVGLPVERIGFDWNAVIHRVNANFDEARLGHPRPTVEISWLLLFRAPRSQTLADLLSNHMHYELGPVEKVIHKDECQARLLRITLGMLRYEREHGTLPPAFTVDAQGNPLHSWRVLLLPHLGEAELYSQIRRDEPWNSPHNQAFHTAADHLYQCPSHPLPPGETRYAVVVGDGTPFSGPQGRTLNELGPDRADRVVVLERNRPANWMDPTQEVPLANALRGIHPRGWSGLGLGTAHPGGLQAGLLSGGVDFLSENIDIEILRNRLDGTPIEPDSPDPEPQQ